MTLLNPQTTSEVWTLLLTLSIGFAAVFTICIQVIRASLERGKSWIITVPEVVGGWATVERRLVRDGKITDKRKDGLGTIRILLGDAAYPTNKGPLHLMTSEGVNLVAPTKDEPGLEAVTGDDIKQNAMKWRRLRIWDALTNWRAAREHDMEKLYNSTGDKPHWMEKLFPIAAVLLFGCLLVLAFVLYKVLPIIANAG